MDITEAVERVRLGESLRQLSTSYRLELLADLGLDPAEAKPSTFQKETRNFMNKLCRHLGDRHAGESYVGAALRDWVRFVDDYEAYDALLSGFEFEDKQRVVSQGKALFPGPLTAHWDG